MQVFVRTEKVLPKVQYVYTDPSGQERSMDVVGIVLSNGLDSIYAELCGREAEEWDKKGGVPEGCMATADLRLMARSYTTKDGETRHETRVKIREIAVLAD